MGGRKREPGCLAVVIAVAIAALSQPQGGGSGLAGQQVAGHSTDPFRKQPPPLA